MKSGFQAYIISKQCDRSSDISTFFWQQWQQYRDYLYRCCIKWMGGNPTDAEDTLSRAMLKAREKVQKYAGEIANFKAWVTSLTHNLCVDIYRERSRGANRVEDIEAIGEEQGLVQSDDTPESAMETGERRMVIRRAIDNLPTRLRETFILHFYQEMSYQEIAQQQEISYQNVCKRISQARKILRLELRGYFIGEEGTDTDKSIPPTATESAIEKMSQGNRGAEAIAAGKIKTFQIKRTPCFEIENRLKRHDGDYRWILNKGVPRFERDGNFEGYIGLCFEITKRKQAEAALRESEERFRQMTENCNELFWLASADMSQLLYVSPAYEKIWGRSCSSLYLQAQLWLDVIHSDDRDRVFSYLQNSVTNTDEDNQYYQEYRIVRPDGSICWIGDRCFPVRNDSGQIYRLAGIARDITDRKLAEEAIRQQNEREKLVAAMTQRIRRTLNLDEILNTAVKEVQQLLGCDRVLIYRVWPEGTGSVVKEAIVPGFRSILGITFPEEVFPCGYQQLYFHGRIRAISDVKNSDISACLADFLRELQVKAKIVVPLIHGEELWGLIIAHQCRSTRDWQSFEINLLSQLSTQLALAIQQASLFEQLQAANQELNRIARLDGLTKVANRRYFDEYLEREWRRLFCEQQPLSLILCDIDYFKTYNDTYGHQAGDECLQKVAKAIERSLKRPEDFVARYGGEEFAVVLPNTKAEGAMKVASEIRSYVARLAIGHVNSEVNQYVTLSLGVAVMVPTPNSSPEQLIYTADLGLYEAKSQGRDRAVLKISR